MSETIIETRQVKPRSSGTGG